MAGQILSSPKGHAGLTDFYSLVCRVCWIHNLALPGSAAQSVTFLTTDAHLTADPGVPSSIPALSNIFMEIDHDIISMVILLPSADSFKKDCCRSQAKVYAQITG